MRPATDSVLTKTVLILDVVGDQGVLGASEMSRRTGLAKGTVHRLAGELVTVRLLERAGDGYRLGPKLFELGSRVPGRRQFREAALPFLEDLSRATDQTVHLAALDGTDVVFVERLVGKRSSEVPSAVADRMPLHCAATGKCLLAFGPAALLDDVLGGGLEPMTALSITNPDELAAELDQVRSLGFSRENGEVAEGVCSVAAPIWELGHTLAGALSATGPIDEFDDAHVTAIVRLAAAGLSHRLGAE